MVSFIGKTHMFVLEPEVAKRLHHFATAFFGTYLQGKSEYRELFSEEFVSQFDDLAWGACTRASSSTERGSHRKLSCSLFLCILCLALLLTACNQQETVPKPESRHRRQRPGPRQRQSRPHPLLAHPPHHLNCPRCHQTEWHLVVIGDSSLWGLGEDILPSR